MIHVEREGNGAQVKITGSGDEIMSEIACAVASAVGRGCEMCDDLAEVKHALAQHIFTEIVNRSAVAIHLRYGVNVFSIDEDLEDEPDEAEEDNNATTIGPSAEALKWFMVGFKGEI